MAATVQCVVASGATSRSLSSTQPTDCKGECSSNLPISVFITSGTRRTIFGGQQIGVSKQRSDGILSNNLQLETRQGRGTSICRRAGPPGDNEKKTDTGGDGGEGKDTVEKIEKALGEAFGGPLWFGVLLVSLAVFGGGYVYLIYNYADFADIPILNGPKRY